MEFETAMQKAAVFSLHRQGKKYTNCFNVSEWLLFTPNAN